MYSLAFEVMTVFSNEFLRAVAEEYMLSPSEKEAFEVIFGSNKSMEAVSDELNITLPALRVRLSTVYKKFKINDSGPVKLAKLRQLLTSKYDASGVYYQKAHLSLDNEEKAYTKLEQYQQILQPESLDWALEHALKFKYDELLPTLFEYKAIKYDWFNVRNYLLSQNLLQWKVRPYKTLKVPKYKFRYAFRLITQVDPLDFLIFAAIIKEIGADIESQRVSTDSNIVFSYRYSPEKDGDLFNLNIGYPQFLEQIKKIVEQEPGFTFVLEADIADFYPNIYLPLLEKALNITSSLHVKVIMNLLNGWSSIRNFGIPVGDSPSRLLAEIAISNVDYALLANGIKFIRYVDDYRIFATSYTEAYRYLAFLIDVLETNKLDLQAAKTKILPVEDYLDKLPLPSKEQRQKLKENLGILNLYEQKNIKNIYENNEDKQLLVRHNLINKFRQSLKSKDICDNFEEFILSSRLIINYLTDTNNHSLIKDVLDQDNLVLLLPAFRDIIKYLDGLEGLDPEKLTYIGKHVLQLVENSIISELEYYRIWALNLFASSTKWNNKEKLIELLASDLGMSRRQLILSLVKINHKNWLQAQWNQLDNEPPWSRRALLVGASCLPDETKEYWYKFIESKLDDFLDRIVLKWAIANSQ